MFRSLLALTLFTTCWCLEGAQSTPSLEAACLARCTATFAVAHAKSSHDALGPCRQFASSTAAVSNACGHGMVQGSLPGCREGCRADSMCFDSLVSSVVREAQQGACAALQQVAPRPLAYDACLHGFRAGLSSACSASHHWAATEAQARRAGEEAAAAQAQAAALAETEARLESSRAEAQRAAQLAEQHRLRTLALAEEAARKAAEEAAALEAAKKGKMRGAGKK